MQKYLVDLVEGKKDITKSKNLDFDILSKTINTLPKPISFYDALTKEGLSIIGEIKKASPSKGIILEDMDVLSIAKEYNLSVDAISVLTEERKFLGRDEYIPLVAEEVQKPILCKDFITSKVQIAHARVLGASSVLLIVAILTDEELKSLYDYAVSIDLDVLVETHTKTEIERALRIHPKIVGINNRNLDTFETTLQTTISLRQYIPEGITVVSESGIFNANDIALLKEVNYDAVLVGESFMRCDNKANLALEMRKAYD